MNFHGRSRISARHPEAQAICDRCGFCYSRSDLGYQHEYAGARLIDTRMLVCPRCTDVPCEWVRGQATPLGPDPLPVRDPRPDTSTTTINYATDENGRVLVDENGVPLTTDDVLP